MASGITCASCVAPLPIDQTLLARRFLLDAGQRRLPVPEVLRATTPGAELEDPGDVPVLDYSRAAYQFLLGCPACLAITRTDRPVAADDVVPGRISLAVPAEVVVRAARRLESAASGGRTGAELRSLCADPLRRYAARMPAVFRAGRRGFGDALMLVADVTATLGSNRDAGPQGLVWDDGRRAGEVHPRLRRLVRRALPVLVRDCSALPFERGEVSVNRRRFLEGEILRFGRGTRLPILGEDDAAFRVAAPRVQFDEERHQRHYERLLPPDGFLLPLDLAVPA